MRRHRRRQPKPSGHGILIGFFVNMLPIRTRVSADMEFDHLLKQVEQNCHEAFEYQDYPFDLLVRKPIPRGPATAGRS